MNWRLHMHPLSSYCWKALIAFRETGVSFDPVVVDLSAPATRDGYLRISPMGKIPALEDLKRGVAVHETSIMIEYLAMHEPAMRSLLPADPQAALRVRLLDRVFDLHVHNAMQKIVLDNIRPEGQRDPFGVAQALNELRQALDWLDTEIGAPWACGSNFTLADCAAAPFLFYADWTQPIPLARRHLRAYRQRLLQRPSFACVVEQARPYRHFFPLATLDRD